MDPGLRLAPMHAIDLKMGGYSVLPVRAVRRLFQAVSAVVVVGRLVAGLNVELKHAPLLSPGATRP